MKKIALITGISGQDGSYLAELLLSKNYEVHGTIRRHSETATHRIDHILSELKLVHADMTDSVSIHNVIKDVKPHEIYNLAAQSHIKVGFENPVYTANVVAIGTLHLLEAMRSYAPYSKFYQAGTSDMYGDSIDADGFQRETTAFNPSNPYACSKLFAHKMCVSYRNSHKLFISNGILFNHESPRRDELFVTSKIIKGAINISRKKETELQLGTLDTFRDWGHAKDYVRAMWMMLQHSDADDFVCASGETRSIRQLCEYVFSKLGMDYTKYVKIDTTLSRPETCVHFKGDAAKLKNATGWKSEYTFETLLDEMINHYL